MVVHGLWWEATQEIQTQEKQTQEILPILQLLWFLFPGYFSGHLAHICVHTLMHT